MDVNYVPRALSRLEEASELLTLARISRLVLLGRAELSSTHRHTVRSTGLISFAAVGPAGL